MLDAGAMSSRFAICSSNAASFIWTRITPDSIRPGTRGCRPEVGIERSLWGRSVWNGWQEEGELEIGRKPISKSEIRNVEFDCLAALQLVQFEISDFGPEMGFRPISKFLSNLTRTRTRYKTLKSV